MQHKCVQHEFDETRLALCAVSGVPLREREIQKKKKVQYTAVVGDLCWAKATKTNLDDLQVSPRSGSVHGKARTATLWTMLVQELHNLTTGAHGG